MVSLVFVSNQTFHQLSPKPPLKSPPPPSNHPSPSSVTWMLFHLLNLAFPPNYASLLFHQHQIQYGHNFLLTNLVTWINALIRISSKSSSSLKPSSRFVTRLHSQSHPPSPHPPKSSPAQFYFPHRGKGKKICDWLREELNLTVQHIYVGSSSSSLSIK